VISADGRLAVPPAEACRLLGVGRTTFYEVILPSLAVVRIGRRVLVPVGELERWLEAHARRIVEP
jgi:excisionase family DNA binding protein